MTRRANLGSPGIAGLEHGVVCALLALHSHKASPPGGSCHPRRASRAAVRIAKAVAYRARLGLVAALRGAVAIGRTLLRTASAVRVSCGLLALRKSRRHDTWTQPINACMLAVYGGIMPTTLTQAP